jgi:tetratricopeptide (TPR) repeat protein
MDAHLFNLVLVPASVSRSKRCMNSQFAALEALISDGHLEEALTQIDALSETDVDDDIRHLKAQCLNELGQLQASQHLYLSLIQKYPQEPLLRIELADLLIRNDQATDEDVELGIAHLNEAQQFAAADEELMIEIRFLQGLAYSQLGDFNLAKECFSQVAHEIPEAQFELAVAYFESGDFDAAKKRFDRLAAEHPEDAWSFHYLGLIAERKNLDPLPFFQRAMAIDSEEFTAGIHLSSAEFSQALLESIAQLDVEMALLAKTTHIEVTNVPSDALVKLGISPTSFGFLNSEMKQLLLFQKNLERFAKNRAELIENLVATLVQELEIEK